MSAVRVPVVAHKTAATTMLAELVAARAAREACVFTLLVPATAHGLHWAVDPEDQCCELRAYRGGFASTSPAG
jgi:hypothetical protein